MAFAFEDDSATTRIRLYSRADKPGLIGVGMVLGLSPFWSFFMSDVKAHPWGWFVGFAVMVWPFLALLASWVLPGIGAVLEIDRTTMKLIRSGQLVWSVVLADVAWIRRIENLAFQNGIELLGTDGKTLGVIPIYTIPPQNQKAFKAALDAATRPYLSENPAPPVIDSRSRMALLVLALTGNGLAVSLLLVAFRLITSPTYQGETTPGWLGLASFPFLGIGLYGLFDLFRKIRAPKISQ